MSGSSSHVYILQSGKPAFWRCSKNLFLSSLGRLLVVSETKATVQSGFRANVSCMAARASSIRPNPANDEAGGILTVAGGWPIW